ncbi:flagellar basal-body MS-ring/collar protein FliF [Niveibacterium sp. 24ML]|uniref:flagellar basal-body MS-ring/collar protein FliF n=1 Tax=Niveibacterium sp. 24ML TaxID=2985512 RepID=UPI0022716D51|nr:flagellar basal-body MS-ring/collar protein FliF [Niveibacterium sp. 24ML]MCX9157934.1 flagellar basal-body MS-ring/collar protein FliF [Niveibacterium sp. 24ML]
MADAELTAEQPAPPQSPLELIRENFNKLTARQKIAGAIAIAMSIALLTGMWLWSKQPNYAVLFSGLAEKDGGAIVTALQAQNIPFKVTDNGSAILVPSNQAAELRLRLASQGLPKGGSVGFELMEGNRIGMSQFHEQVNYQRALEGELGRTIGSLNAVQNARVHLAIPKQTAFLRDEQKPSASVVLTLHGGRVLDGGQIAGIVNLVSASVPQLTASAVSVIDQNGNLLTTRADPSGLDATQIKYVREIEERFVRRIESILEPIVGPTNLRAQVTADVDFDQQEQTAETYKPNPSPNQAIRSQQLADASTMQPAPAGVPGALTNQPPVPATAPITTPAAPGTPGAANQAQPLSTTRNSTTNYELDKTVQHTKRALGQVRRLSVAVVVNHKSERDPKGNVKTVPLTEAEMKQVNDLVREAVGYNETRGDTVNVANAPFTDAARRGDDLPAWKDPELRELAMQIGRWALLAMLALFLWLRVLRPLVRTVAPPPPPVPAPGEAGSEAAGEAEEEEGYVVSLSEPEEIPDDQLLPPEVRLEEIARMSFERKIAKVREIAVKNPKVIATLMKEWMGSSPNERR